MRNSWSIVVVVLSLVLAAALQDSFPVGNYMPVKPLLIGAVALYMMLTRKIWEVLTIILWSSILCDALTGVPLFATLLFFIMVYALLRILQRFFLQAVPWHGALLSGVVAVVQMLWHGLWSGLFRVSAPWDTLFMVGYSALTGMIAGFLVFICCRFADRMAGIIQLSKESHGVLWSEHS